MECLQNSFDFDVRELPGRIWSREGSTWLNEDGDDFQTTNRLGWLNAPSNISDSVGEYVAFADEIRDSGYTKVVLLGMGGSSLFGEVIRQCWGSAEASRHGRGSPIVPDRCPASPSSLLRPESVA